MNTSGMTPSDQPFRIGFEMVCRAGGDIADVYRFHTALCDYVHRHSTMKTFLHSCGSIHALLPDVPPQNVFAMFDASDELARAGA
jgi:hypothetical protein